MAGDIVIWTFDWVPEMPRGFVRDLRLRWACEEGGVGYSVRTVPLVGKNPEHFARQPFGQVPFIDDGQIKLFESGAALLHLARKSAALLPRDAKHESEVIQWIFAALNSIEMVSVPFWFLGVSGADPQPLRDWLETRLGQLEAVLREREWLAAGRFTVADLLMADVLRIEAVRGAGNHAAIEAYLDRVLSRPAFVKARADQLAFYEAADRQRNKEMQDD